MFFHSAGSYCSFCRFLPFTPNEKNCTKANRRGDQYFLLNWNLTLHILTPKGLSINNTLKQQEGWSLGLVVWVWGLFLREREKEKKKNCDFTLIHFTKLSELWKLKAICLRFLFRILLAPFCNLLLQSKPKITHLWM